MIYFYINIFQKTKLPIIIYIQKYLSLILPRLYPFIIIHIHFLSFMYSHSLSQTRSHLPNLLIHEPFSYNSTHSQSPRLTLIRPRTHSHSPYHTWEIWNLQFLIASSASWVPLASPGPKFINIINLHSIHLY